LVFGQVAQKSELLRLLTRINMQRIDTQGQLDVILALFRFYGPKLKAFALDRSGLGHSLWDLLTRHPLVGERCKGYHFSGKYAVGFEDRQPERTETWQDLAIERNIVEHTSDALREYVDSKRLQLPYDQELLTEWQGQSYTIVKTTGSPYGKRDYSRGKFHTLDAGRMMIAAKTLGPVEEMLDRPQRNGPVLERFIVGLGDLGGW
jgi:hypothetical protein